MRRKFAESMDQSFKFEALLELGRLSDCFPRVYSPADRKNMSIMFMS